MFFENQFPVLEFDGSPEAKITPFDFAEGKFETDKLIITFFPEVLEKLADSGLIEQERVIAGENPIVIYRYLDRPDILLTLGQIGCPACGGNLDLFYAMGISKVMFCGGGGVLDQDIQVGQVLVVEAAIRDEGFSYQYVAPSRVIQADQAVVGKICRYLEAENVPHLRGLVWTTDAIFRETEERIRRRKAEGAKIVEMEQAGCLAVAQCRGLTYGALIYGGDDVSGQQWANRGWRSREGIRYNLVALCKELVDSI